MKLAADEQIIRRYHQTKLVLAFYFLFCCLLIWLPLRFVNKYEVADSLGRIPDFWVILVVAYFFNHVVLWRLNYTLLTNHRLLIVSYHNLLHSQVTDLPKDKIVNIAYEKKGLSAAIFGYGNLIIQQQSLNQPAVLKRLPDPEDVKDEIVQVIKTK